MGGTHEPRKRTGSPVEAVRRGALLERGAATQRKSARTRRDRGIRRTTGRRTPREVVAVSNEQEAIAGVHSPDWASLSTPQESEGTAGETCENGEQSTGGPWPSKPNRTDHENEGEKASNAETDEAYWRLAKEFVENAEDDLGDIVFRALSVSGDTRLRREAVRERRGQPGTYRSKTVAGVMQAFLTWFLEQEDLILDFGEFEQPVGSSFDKDAELERYGRLCDFERGALRVAQNGDDDLYTALCGLTASHENADGSARCPGDFMRQLVEDGWSKHTKQALWRAMNDVHGNVERLKDADLEDPPERWWEYARIVEPHDDGQAHIHPAIVTNFEISVETLRPMIEKHVENVPSASWSAHKIDPDDPDESCVTVRKIDPETESEGEVVGNLASYLSGYLAQFDEEGEFVHMLDRSPQEVMFAATAWATGTRKIEFSNGAQDLRRLGYELRPEKYKKSESEGDCPPPTTVRNEQTGEQYDILEPGNVETVFVEDRPELDPEKHFIGGVLEADTR